MHETERLTYLNPESILSLYVPNHRDHVNELLKKTSELVRAKVKHNKNHGSLRKKKKIRGSDLIGADLRDADLRGTNLLGSIFLTQVQVNSANGDIHTKLPPSLSIPAHWMV